MSKISEQKALEAYPIKEEWVGNQYGGLEDVNSLSREKYQEGYDKAMEDFLEKAEMYLKTRVYYNMHPNNVITAIKDFKNYMQDEM
jgi:hypothetical protein